MFEQIVKEYFSENKINQYKRFIKYYYSKYYKEMGLPELKLYKITTVGSFGTERFMAGKSDIDFMLYIYAEINKSDMIGIINYLNDKLIEEYGEIEGKGGRVEVIGVNGKMWFD